ncbi:acyl carrier protein [Saccharothrix sp. NRRL B-16314]|uniref:acyl carrier protein n=1 Tax=Saccharothrix sp. NRRL B-16314 TaxID=1463825 RepID=UPI000525DE37|nr:acyl carrier protein [Saccharothrix sp. NRRL B-16314]
MNAEIRQFLFESLKVMKYSTADMDDDTVLGPAGADLESLAMAELALRVEDHFGVRFLEDEAEHFAAMTVGEFCAEVARRARIATAT